MSFINIYQWALQELKNLRRSQCISHDGSDEQVLYGLVVQKLAEFYNIENITWETAIRANRSGGTIGYGDACPRLHKCLKRCKVCRVHAIFHDAMGFLYKTYGVGNGYDILIGHSPGFPLAGQVTGLLYWTYYYLRKQL